MIKKLVLVFIALIAIQSYGQEGTASPYSFYGIGSLKFKGTVENRSMGGIGVYIDSVHVNLRNPASYATKNLKVYNEETRPVKFAVGGSYSSINLKADSGSDKASSTTFDYVALSIPMGKFGFGFGLMPYTSVGYKLESLNGDGNIENRFRGEGGLNKAFLGLGYRITDGLSIGIDAQYNFGNIQNSTVEYLYDNGVVTQYQSRESNRSDLSGLNFNLGLSYTTPIAKNMELVATATYTPESDLTSKNERSVATITTNSNTGQEFVNNSVDIDLEALGLLETDLILPSKMAFGLGIGKPTSWFVGAEYTMLNTSDFSNDLYSSAGVRYEDASTISVGGFYIPDYRSLTSYLKRTVYRAGVRYEKTGLNINSESINEFGISFGVGLPLSGPISSANIGFEVGKRGTTNNNLIQENFINLQLSLSLGDRWFQRRKYN
ncbi:hypothetical protein [Seonamhaeicola sp.]|uniref:hypothetical protein n=1 Tax=Seonamhaeicola sp. TaxID=1912245 RepID=UPI0026238E3F|nr:hypothetical protein [Seonamhaeicola sp.]